MDLYSTFDPRLGPIHEDDFQPDPHDAQQLPHKAQVLNDIAEIPETGDFITPSHDPAQLKYHDQNFDKVKSSQHPPDRPDSQKTDSFRSLFVQHAFEVIVYCIVFGSFGMSVALLGPTILDLGCQTTTDLERMSWVFFVQLSFTLLGSISAGCLCHIISGNALLIFTTLGIPMMFFLLPSCTSTLALLICLAAMGWFMGCVDCIANLQMLKLYGAKVTPFLQMMYFCYGLGAFLSPMISQPFLLNNDCSPYIDGYEKTFKVPELEKQANISLKDSIPSKVNITEPDGELMVLGIMNITKNATHFGKEEPAEIAVKVPPDLYMLYLAKMKTEVRFAFYILGAIQVPIPFIVLFLYVRLKRQTNPYNITGPVPTNEKSDYGSLAPLHEEETKKEGRCCKQDCYIFKSREIITIALLASFMLFFLDGIESSYGGFIYSYSIKKIERMDKREGAEINACFWGLFAFGRLLSIILSTRLTSAFMLLGNIIGCACTTALLLLFNSSHVMIYLGTCLIGLFLSSCSPSIFALSEQYIDVQSSVTSMLVVSAASGEMIFPLIVGNLFVSLGPLSLFVYMSVVLAVTFLLYIAFLSVGTHSTKWKETIHKSFIWLAGYEAPVSPEQSTVIDRVTETIHKSFIWLAGYEAPVSPEQSSVIDRNPYTRMKEDYTDNIDQSDNTSQMSDNKPRRDNRSRSDSPYHSDSPSRGDNSIRNRNSNNAYRNDSPSRGDNATRNHNGNNAYHSDSPSRGDNSIRNRDNIYHNDSPIRNRDNAYRGDSPSRSDNSIRNRDSQRWNRSEYEMGRVDNDSVDPYGLR